MYLPQSKYFNPQIQEKGRNSAAGNQSNKYQQKQPSYDPKLGQKRDAVNKSMNYSLDGVMDSLQDDPVIISNK